MKMLTLATVLTALTLGGAAQAAPVPAQTGLLAPEGAITQVRDRSMGHGSMRGMRHGGGMRGMQHGRGMRGMNNMRGMNHRM